MNKTILFLIFLTFLLFSQNIYSNETLPITIVAEQDFPPYNFNNQDYKPTGISVDLIQAIIDDLGMNNKIMTVPWARCYKMGLKQKNVLVVGISKMKHRNNLFKWVGKITSFSATFYKLKKRDDIIIKNLEDLKKYTIGVLLDDSRAQYLLNKGFKKDLQLIINRSNTLSFKQLFFKRIDLVPFDKPGLKYLLQHLNDNNNEIKFFYDINKLKEVYTINDFSEGLWIAFNKETSDKIVNKFRESYQRIAKKGVIEKLQKKWDCLY